MNKTIFFIAVFLLLAVSAPAQVPSLGSLYDLDSFTAPDAVREPGAQVKLNTALAVESGRCYLVVEATVEPTWHIYSVTQPEGGTIRTTFELPMRIGIEAILPSKAPHVNDKMSDLMGVSIEEHAERIVWFALLDVKEPPQTLKGTLRGQVCQDGEGGVCVPISVPFEAEFDPNFGPLTKALDAAGKVPRQFQYHTNSPHPNPRQSGSDLPEGEGTGKNSPHPNPRQAGSDLPEGEGTGEKSPHPQENFTPQEITKVSDFRTALLYAFLGGIILNVMPCVLPVIGLKILSFFEQAGKSRIRALALNLSYSLGLLSVFIVLAFLSVGLSKMFTFDLFNIVMVCVVFAMALSLMDVWEISVPGFLGTGKSGELMRQEGHVGAFFKGIITTLLAIPCGAPLLSPAVNWADMQIRSGQTLSVFLAYACIGLGMASPYLVIGAFPEMLRFLPKPGDWMESFKKIMGFCLLGAVVWILYFVQLERLLPTVALLFALWFSCWMIGRLDYAATADVHIRSWIVSLTVIGIVLVFSFQLPGIGNRYTLEGAMEYRIYGSQTNHWKPYTPEAFDAALKSNRPVIAEFTADWCLTCKTLAAFVLDTEPVLELLERKNIASFVVDCTKEGDGTKFLRQFGPEQVPVLVIYDPKRPAEPIVLRGGYTQKTLVELLEKL